MTRPTEPPVGRGSRPKPTMIRRRSPRARSAWTYLLSREETSGATACGNVS
jgi:hypothetical protein